MVPVLFSPTPLQVHVQMLQDLASCLSDVYAEAASAVVNLKANSAPSLQLSQAMA